MRKKTFLIVCLVVLSRFFIKESLAQSVPLGACFVNGTCSRISREGCKTSGGDFFFGAICTPCEDITCENSYSTTEGSSSCLDSTTNECPGGLAYKKQISISCVKNSQIQYKTITACFARINDSDALGNLDTSLGGVNNKTLTSLGDFINKIINFLIFVAGALLFINIILAGIKIITSGKDPKTFAEGMKKIVLSTVGIVIVVLAYVVADYVIRLFFGSETDAFGAGTTSMIEESKKG